MSEKDYFVSTCLKAGSVASWGFSPPAYLHSLFGGTPGPVGSGCLLRSPAKDFSAARWHCHLGGTGRPSWSQDLTGPPHSLLILLLPPLPSLQRRHGDPGRPREGGCPLGGLHLQEEGFRRQGLGRDGEEGWGVDPGVDPSLEGRDPPRPVGLGSLMNHASCG